MSDLFNSITNILEKSYHSRPSFFQLNFFLIGKEPTIQAKLKRCADELMVRKQTILAAHMEIEETRDINALLEIEIDNLQENRETDIKTRQNQRRIKANIQRINDIKDRIINAEAEALFFVETYDRLSAIEAPREWDDVDVQTEYWNKKLGSEIQRRLLLQLPVDIETISTVLALPDNVPIKKEIMQVMKAQQERIGELGKQFDKQLE